MDYEVQFNSDNASTLDETTYTIFKDEVQKIWNQIKALYVEDITAFNNALLSKVEKLFNLNSKTSGDAKEIVSKATLTNHVFSQLRLLFNHY